MRVMIPQSSIVSFVLLPFFTFSFLVIFLVLVVLVVKRYVLTLFRPHVLGIGHGENDYSS